MYFPPIISRAELADVTSGREGALLIGTDTKTNLGSATTVEAALTSVNTFVGAINETIDDRVAALIVAGTNVTVSYNDGAGTFTINASAGSHTHTASDITDFAEAVDDRVNGLFVAGTSITLTYNDGANTFTIAVSAHNHAASEITSGTIDTARLGSGTADNTKFLRGDQTWQPVTPTAPTVYTATDGATVTFDLSNSVSQLVVLGGDRTLALSNDSGNMVFDIQIKQDGTGSRLVTWFSGITWAGGVAPTLTTTLNKTDWFGFRRTGSGTYHGVVIAANL